jgi:hypothetical protein
MGGHTEVESQKEREDSSDGDYSELDHANHPAKVAGKMTRDAVEIKL